MVRSMKKPADQSPPGRGRRPAPNPPPQQSASRDSLPDSTHAGSTQSCERWVVGFENSEGSLIALQWALAHGGSRACIRVIWVWKLDLRGVGSYS